MWVCPGGGYRAGLHSDMSRWVTRAIAKVVGVDEDNRFTVQTKTGCMENSEQKLEPKWQIQRVSKLETMVRPEKVATSEVVSLACCNMTDVGTQEL